MSSTTNQKYGSFLNSSDEEKHEDGDGSLGEHHNPPTPRSKMKYGVGVLCVSFLLLAYSRIEPSSVGRKKLNVLANNKALSGAASTSEKLIGKNNPANVMDGNDKTKFKWRKGFWKLELSDVSHIDDIQVTLRGSGKTVCDNLVLEVLDAAEKVVFTTGTSIDCSGTKNRDVDVPVHVDGRSIKITNNKGYTIALENVKVFGYEVTSKPSFSPFRLIGEQAIKKPILGNPAGTVYAPPTDYHLTFTLEPKSLPTQGKKKANIIQFTTGDVYGAFNPVVYMSYDSLNGKSYGRLSVGFGTDSNAFTHVENVLPVSLNEKNTVALSVVGRRLRFSVNGYKTYSPIDERSQLDKLDVYIGGFMPGWVQADAIISDINYAAA